MIINQRLTRNQSLDALSQLDHGINGPWAGLAVNYCHHREGWVIHQQLFHPLHIHFAVFWKWLHMMRNLQHVTDFPHPFSIGSILQYEGLLGNQEYLYALNVLRTDTVVIFINTSIFMDFNLTVQYNHNSIYFKHTTCIKLCQHRFWCHDMVLIHVPLIYSHLEGSVKNSMRCRPSAFSFLKKN